ncbi:hypothetical protein GGD65_007804 [Bradyrhizobium sp. CIR18]|nr:hypothetical protein [Bradyrhizobium sp. CIR18]
MSSSEADESHGSSFAEKYDEGPLTGQVTGTSWQCLLAEIMAMISMIAIMNCCVHDRIKKDPRQIFIDWLISSEGQGAIADYKVNG